MVDYLVNRGSAVPGLWTDRGVVGEDVKIRDCLDNYGSGRVWSIQCVDNSTKVEARGGREA